MWKVNRRWADNECQVHIAFDKLIPISGGNTVNLFPWVCNSLNRGISPISLGRAIKSLSLTTNWRRKSTLWSLYNGHNTFWFAFNK